MIAGEAMKEAVSALTPALEATGEKREVLGTFVIGTIKGDIYDEGKTIVATTLTAAGFKVFDISKDSSNSAFAEAIMTYKPDVLGVISHNDNNDTRATGSYRIS